MCVLMIATAFIALLPASVSADPEVETLYVDARSWSPVYSQPLAEGQLYQIKVSGTYSFWTYMGQIIDTGVDAEYIYNYDPPEKVSPGWGFLINGIDMDSTPPDYNEDHVYYYYIIGDQNSASFVIRDTWYNDNGGGLTVEIRPALEGIDDYFQDIPDECLKGGKPKVPFHNQIDAVNKMIENGNYNGAINKLEEIRDNKVGKWVECSRYQGVLTGMINRLIEYLESLA